ncbi:hypothetical protein D6827_02795 [Candidatus Parcubacteria bacterium]|nr:MAG: hypothetical protein D6827_02795 [Candidatus Parcubacteria bacterium]
MFKNYIFMEKVKQAIDIAIENEKNLLLYGPPGHGKSEFVYDYLKSITDQEPFVVQMAKDMNEAEVFGGIDFRRLNSSEDPDLRYKLGDSFLNHEYVIFEELLDAPASTLLSLKDTITRRMFARGDVQFPMKTKVIIAITNKDPKDISALGDEYHAIIERFHLVLRVAWQEYTARNFEQMIKKLGDKHNNSSTICRIAEKAINEGNFISPRSIVIANSLCRKDFEALQFIPGFQQYYREIRDIFEQERERQQWIAHYDAILAEFDALCNELASMSINEKVKAYKQIKELHRQLTDRSYPSDYEDNFETLKGRMNRVMINIQKEVLG